jgi:hypothetical protein
MLTIAIILCYLSGASILLAISRKYTLAELVGYSFLLGIGLESVFLFLLDVVGVQYSQPVLLGLNLAFIALVNGLNYKGLLALKSEFKVPSFALRDINLVAVFILCIVGYLFYAITVKNLFWPPTEHDTLGSFDKLGRIMALEGKLKISLFDHHLQGAGGLYPPLYHASFAYVYIFGAIMPKIITTLFFVSMLTTFYSVVARYAGSTAAALFTLLFMITPELFAHAALSLGNMPTTAYIGAAALATIVWLDTREQKYFWLAALSMAGVTWIRSDTIVFTAAAFLLIGIDFLRHKNLKQTAIYYAISIAPFIIWMLYMKLKLGSGQTNKFDLGIGYNAERWDLMTGYIKAFLFGAQKGSIDGGQLYGIVFLLFFVAIFANATYFVWKMVKSPEFKAKWVSSIFSPGFNAVLFTGTSFVLYFIVFYLIDEEAQKAPIASLMESSFKRGMFFFIPTALFYAAANPLSAALFHRLEKFRLGN